MNMNMNEQFAFCVKDKLIIKGATNNKIHVKAE